MTQTRRERARERFEKELAQATIDDAITEALAEAGAPAPWTFTHQADGTVWLGYRLGGYEWDKTQEYVDANIATATAIGAAFPPLDRVIRRDTFLHNCNVDEVEAVRAKYPNAKSELNTGAVYLKISEYDTELAFDCYIAGTMCKVHLDVSRNASFNAVRFTGELRNSHLKTAYYQSRYVVGMPDDYASLVYAAGTPDALGNAVLYTNRERGATVPEFLAPLVPS